MKQTERSGRRTLLWSVILSAPGPLVVGMGLLVGRSATQIADFVRRSAELLAILVSFLVYHFTTRDGFTDEQRKLRLEYRTGLFVGGAMCLGGSMMLLLAVLSGSRETGNVLPGLSIAVLGVVANGIFWRKYSRLGAQSGNSILMVQSRLYRAKTLVDGCVTIALLAVALFPASPAAQLLDKAGSAIVAAYLIRTGIKTIAEKPSLNS